MLKFPALFMPVCPDDTNLKRELKAIAGKQD